MTCIGGIGRPHGVHGGFSLTGRRALLCLEPANEYPAHLGASPKEGRAVTILRHQVLQGRDVLHVRELSDRTAVEAHAGTSLWMHARFFADPNAPWTGCTVFDATGVSLGVLRDIVNHGATPNAQIESPNGDWLEVPFVESYFRLDAAQAKTSKQVHLTVEAEILEDLWDRASTKTPSCNESP